MNEFFCNHGQVVSSGNPCMACENTNAAAIFRRSDALSRLGDPTTSRRAAASIKTLAAEKRFLDALGANERCNYCLALQMGEERGTISPRVKPLIEKGKLMLVDEHVHNGTSYQSYRKAGESKSGQ